MMMMTIKVFHSYRDDINTQHMQFRQHSPLYQLGSLSSVSSIVIINVLSCAMCTFHDTAL